MPNIRRIIKEFIENDLDWIQNTESNFDPHFIFKGKEHWVDVEGLSNEEKLLIREYLLKVTNYRSGRAFRKHTIDKYKGFVVHCGTDENDYEPEADQICYMNESFTEDEYTDNSIYVDGREVLEYIKLTSQDETLDESLGWSDKDSISWDTDKNFSSDPYNINDPNWTSTPEKSYWVQGGGGGASSGGEETVKEVEDILDNEDDLEWIRDIKEYPNYEGFPQGVVMVDSHQDIDTLRELLEKINPKDFKGRGEWHHLHQALEYKRDEFESEDMDASDAVISVSFFVERGYEGGLSFGYWGYEVNDNDIAWWLNEGETYNREYRLYNSVYDLEKDFENLTI